MGEKIGLAEVYLTFLVEPPSKEVKKEYLKCIKEIPPEQFAGTGWSLYEECYERVLKSKSNNKDS